MKTIKVFFSAILTLMFISSFGQVTIWTEDFNSYTNYTVNGQGTPAITTWTAEGGNINNGKGIFVVSSALRGHRTTNLNPIKTYWSTDVGDPIEIDGFSNVSISIALSSSGVESNDALWVQYSIDGGAFTHFGGSPFSGAVNTTATISGLSGNTLRLLIRMVNDKQNDYYYADNILVTGSLTPTTWTGNTSTFWNDPSNWSTNTIPGRGSAVTIPASPAGGNFPELNTGAGAICYDLTIEAGAHLYVPVNNSLTVSGALTNNAGTSGLIIKSDATGTGSLIHNSNGVNASVEQYLTANAWHYVSSPISNATANVFFGIYLKSFDEPTYAWNDYIVDPATPLTPMLGYSSWVSGTDATVSFPGFLNNGAQSIAVTAQATGTNIGWNLVGNPYPSAVDWNAATGWTKTNVDATIYFWKGVGGPSGSGNYHYYNPAGGAGAIGIGDATQFIPPMQGFFVHASADGSLAVNNNARVHNTQAYWKSTAAVTGEIPLIRLQAENEAGLTDETVVRFYPESTMEYDGEYDAFKLDGYMYPQIYSITAGGVNLAINTLPQYKKGTIIPLGFTSPVEGEYSIKLDDFENFKNETLYLEDLLTDVMVELAANADYNFNSAPEDDPNRFLLHFSKAKYKDAPLEKTGAEIYAYEKSVYIQTGDEVLQDVSVFNLMGQKVLQTQKADKGLIKIDLNVKPGYYVVKARSGNTIISEKVLIR